MSAIHQVRNIRSRQGQRSKLPEDQLHDTYRYLSEKVDPIMSKCITHLLLTRPDNVVSEMTEYFQSNLVDTPVERARKTTKLDRLFMAKEISPVLIKLMNRLVHDRPDSVAQFILKELGDISGEASPIRETNLTISASTPTLANNATSTVTSLQRSFSTNALKDVRIVVLGLDGAGKSTLVSHLTGDFSNTCKPTTGFRPINVLCPSKSCNLNFYDLGGHIKFRSVWPRYYHDIHSLIYVINEDDDARLVESCSVLSTLLNHPFIMQKPILVVRNRCRPDLNDGYVNDCINNRQNVIVTSVPMYSIDPDVAGESSLEPALELLLDVILQSYSSLQSRLDHDTSEVNEQIAIEKQKKEIDVLSRLLMTADDSSQSDYILSGENEAVAFLSGEVGEDVGCNEVALQIIDLSSRHRLVLQMVGNYKCPVSSKKKAMSWSEILGLLSKLKSGMCIE